MKLNHEKLKSQFVNFDNKKKLTVNTNDFVKGKQNQWPDVFEDFSN